MISRLSAAALLSVVLAGCGGTEVKGIVRDEESGQPLPGAIVRVGDESTRSGTNGFYELEVDVDDEPAQFMVGAPGYEPKSMMVSIDEDQDTVYSDIDLKKEFSEREFDREQMQLQRRHLEQERRALHEQRQELEDLQMQQDAQRRKKGELWQAEQNVQEAEQNVQEAEQNVQEAEQKVQEALQEGNQAEQQLEQPKDETWTPVEPIEQPEGQ